MELITLKKPQKDEDSGKTCYFTQPPDTRVAKLQDFYRNPTTHPVLIINKPFWTHSYKDGYFWGSRVNEHFPYPGSDFSVFLENGRVFIRNY